MGHIESEKLSIIVAAEATTGTATSTKQFNGRVVKIEIDPGDMATSATLKAYCEKTALATGTRDHCLNYTFPESQAELVIYPMKACTDNTGAAIYAYQGIDTEDPDVNVPLYQPYVVDGAIKLDLASAAAADSVSVTFYVES